ncbi:hypothetical protein [Mycoplasmopsis glycophila]|uniref:Uncharacterized protein n=1 Tax=Mycoplasmopsis glycophila TaxID=171285 RepID=A0A449AW75_9BACT|nr:hypothetical protein [Mycoplasmopsis glycophila]VEU70882.1 Uncharacterised protein [Mycoplasmopsis glycophila]
MKKEIFVDYAIYRQIFLKDVRRNLQKVEQSRFALMKKSTKEKIVEKYKKLARELETGQIKNENLVANRKLFNKFQNEIKIRAYLPYFIVLLFLVLILMLVFLFLFK